jgi:hypothetical protein
MPPDAPIHHKLIQALSPNTFNEQHIMNQSSNVSQPNSPQLTHSASMSHSQPNSRRASRAGSRQDSIAAGQDGQAMVALPGDDLGDFNIDDWNLDPVLGDVPSVEEFDASVGIFDSVYSSFPPNIYQNYGHLAFQPYPHIDVGSSPYCAC